MIPASQTKTPPLQSQNTALYKGTESTLVRLAPKSRSNSPCAAFAIVKLPPHQGGGTGSTQSKVAIVKLSPYRGNINASSLAPSSAVTTRPGAPSLAPYSNTNAVCWKMLYLQSNFHLSIVHL